MPGLVGSLSVFTGLVEEMGTYLGHDGDRYRISSRVVSEDAKVGDSVAVNGCCVTVVARTGEIWETELTAETLSRTTFGLLRPGDAVNLERPVRASDRLGGHVVQGHVDTIGEVTAGPPDLEVRVNHDLIRYCVEKGSIAVDGVSLTIFDVGYDSFAVAIIPHTSEVTTIGRRVPGDKVNIEVDIAAKQIEKLLSPYLAKLG
ncbi:MAG: riboflavin synthase [Acidimicrobiales bacterium]|jgi:riboflavin synthase